MSEIRKTKEVTEVKQVIIGHKCDCCGKTIEGKSTPNDWFHFSSGHEDWGNDSFESIEYYDACSPKCFLGIAENALKELKDYANSAKVADMPYAFVMKMINHLQNSPTPPTQ